MGEQHVWNGLCGFGKPITARAKYGLQNWLNLFYFYWNTPGDAFQKAQAFIELAVKKRKILRYRIGGRRKIPINPEIFIPHVQIRVFIELHDRLLPF